MGVGKTWIGIFVLSISLGSSLTLAFAPSAQAQAMPHYGVDASWPKLLPNKWRLANAPALAMDKNAATRFG